MGGGGGGGEEGRGGTIPNATLSPPFEPFIYFDLVLAVILDASSHSCFRLFLCVC